MIIAVVIAAIMVFGSWCNVTRAGEKENICYYGGMEK